MQGASTFMDHMCTPFQWNTLIILFIHQVNSWHTCNTTMKNSQPAKLHHHEYEWFTVMGYTPSKGYLLDLFLNADSLKDCLHMYSWYNKNFTLLWAKARQAKIMLYELSVTHLFSSYCEFFLTFIFQSPFGYDIQSSLFNIFYVCRNFTCVEYWKSKVRVCKERADWSSQWQWGRESKHHPGTTQWGPAESGRGYLW